MFIILVEYKPVCVTKSQNVDFFFFFWSTDISDKKKPAMQLILCTERLAVHKVNRLLAHWVDMPELFSQESREQEPVCENWTERNG